MADSRAETEKIQDSKLNLLCQKEMNYSQNNGDVFKKTNKKHNFKGLPIVKFRIVQIK